MPLTYLSGDPLLTQQQILAFGSNAAGRTETTPCDCPPAALSDGLRQLWQAVPPGAHQAGHDLALVRNQARAGFMVVRETPVGATRLRHVEAVLMALARDYRVDNIRSLALAPLGADFEAAAIREVIDRWLANPRSGRCLSAINRPRRRTQLIRWRNFRYMKPRFFDATLNP